MENHLFIWICINICTYIQSLLVCSETERTLLNSEVGFGAIQLMVPGHYQFLHAYCTCPMCWSTVPNKLTHGFNNMIKWCQNNTHIGRNCGGGIILVSGGFWKSTIDATKETNLVISLRCCCSHAVTPIKISMYLLVDWLCIQKKGARFYDAKVPSTI